jgi:predicted acetyltransferase/8-oxo-dGTP pyrophosphatase MutT (NUDIX family)
VRRTTNSATELNNNKVHKRTCHALIAAEYQGLSSDTLNIKKKGRAMMETNFTYRLPTLEDEQDLKEYVQEHYANGETSVASSMDLTTTDYLTWLSKVQKQSIIPNDGWGRTKLYLVRFNGFLVGLMNVRPEMSQELRDIYGNIGYGVRPSARQMGFATQMLKHALEECKEHGLQVVVLGCIKENIASAKTMIKCGGQLIKEEKGTVYKPGRIRQYYQFRLADEINEPELWDLYDKDRNLAGKDHIRGIWPIPDNYYHLVVHVWLRNSEGKYLIAQRSAKRASNPLMWECPGGSVTKGEDSLTGAIREVKEEVGIDLNPENGRVVFSQVRDVVDGRRFGDIMDVWVFNCDGKANLVEATTDEVAQTKWVDAEEIQEMMDRGIFVKTLAYFFDRVAEK